MKNKIFSRLLAIVMTGMLLAGSMNVVAFAEEQTEVVAEDAENAEQPAEEIEALDGYVEGDLDTSAGEVTMSGITSSNGRVIAATFPDAFLPEGFKKDTCTYEGQTIEIARMIADASGEVVLAYLADEDGSNGDFYLCDIMTAEMSDFIQIKNGNEGYIIVLDPGDVIVAPSGFRRAEFQYYGKSGIAWRLPAKDGEKTAAAIIQNPFAPVTVYAASAGAGALDSLFSTVTNSDKKEAEEEEADKSEASDEKADKKESSKASSADAEDGSRIVTADPAEFIMVYAVDNTGTVGFYLYDTVQETYQRYVSIDSADSSMVAQYQKDAKVRLIIICVLAVILVIMLFVIVNLMLNRRDDYDDEDDEDEDEVEAVRRSVEQKTRTQAAPAPAPAKRVEYEEEEDDEEEEEEEEVYEQPVKAQRAPARRNMRHLMDIEDADEDEEYAYKQSARRATPAPAERKPAVRREEPVREGQREGGPRFTRNGQPVKRTGVPQSGAHIEEGVMPAQKAPRGEANVVKRSAGNTGAPARRPSSSRENVERRPVTGPSRRSAESAERRQSQARRPRPKADFDDDFEFEFIDIDE